MNRRKKGSRQAAVGRGCEEERRGQATDCLAAAAAAAAAAAVGRGGGRGQATGWGGGREGKRAE